MNQEIRKVFRNIENNIEGCDVLNTLLKELRSGEEIDYDDLCKKGYKNDEIYLGAELIELYITLKKYVDNNEKNYECKKNCM